MKTIYKTISVLIVILIYNSNLNAQIVDWRHSETAGDFFVFSIDDNSSILEFKIDAIKKAKELVNIDTALNWLEKDLNEVLDSVSIDMPVKIIYSGIGWHSRKLKIEPVSSSLEFTFDDSKGAIIKRYKYVIELDLFRLSFKYDRYDRSYTQPYPGTNSKLIIYTNDLAVIDKLSSNNINQHFYQALEKARPDKYFRRETSSAYSLYTDKRPDSFKQTDMKKGNKNLFESIYYVSLGMGLIQSEIVPNATLKMLFPIKVNTNRMTEIGLTYSLYVFPKTTNIYNIDLYQFLGFEIKCTDLVSKRYFGNYFGKLLKRDGLLFKKDTYYVGAYYPLSKRLSMNLTYFFAKDQFMPELGFKFWID